MLDATEQHDAATFDLAVILMVINDVVSASDDRSGILERVRRTVRAVIGRKAMSAILFSFLLLPILLSPLICPVRPSSVLPPTHAPGHCSMASIPQPTQQPPSDKSTHRRSSDADADAEGPKKRRKQRPRHSCDGEFGPSRSIGFASTCWSPVSELLTALQNVEG